MQHLRRRPAQRPSRTRWRRPGVRPRADVTQGIVHFGVGGFHRAHQAMYVDALMNAGRGPRLGHRRGRDDAPGRADARRPRRPRTGSTRSWSSIPDGRREPRVIGSMLDVYLARRRTTRVRCSPLMRAASDAHRLADDHRGRLSVPPVDGGVRRRRRRLIQTRPRGRCRSRRRPFGFIVEALRLRREGGIAPFTVMSCDNIPGNGDVARKMVTAFARLKDPELAEWMARTSVPFPNSMVDRITPVTAPEDIKSPSSGRLRRSTTAGRSSASRSPQWCARGLGSPAAWPDGRRSRTSAYSSCPDVEPYELMKLRLLNASHQALCYLGFLSGYRYAHEVCQDPLFSDFLLAYMDREATPTLQDVPGVDLARPTSTSSSSGSPTPRCATPWPGSAPRAPTASPSGWCPVIRTQPREGGRGGAVGPRRRRVGAVRRRSRRAGPADRGRRPAEATGSWPPRLASTNEPLAFIEDEQLFGDLAAHEAFATAYAASLASLHEVGARATLERLRDQG